MRYTNPRTHCYYSAPPSVLAKYCDERVCLVVCLCLSAREHISETARPIFGNFYARLLRPWLGCSLAALRCDTRFRFKDDVFLR